MYRTFATSGFAGLSCTNSNIGDTVAPERSNASFAIRSAFGSFGFPSWPRHSLQPDSFRLKPAGCVTYGQWPHDGQRYSVPADVISSVVSQVLHLKLRTTNAF